MMTDKSGDPMGHLDLKVFERARLEGNICIRFVPHTGQRYNTLDDYMVHRSVKLFRISDIPNRVSRFAVTIHALVEEFVASSMGVTYRQVDEWDLSHPEANDPGGLKDCPYRRAHLIALIMERAIVKSCGMSWAEHEQNLERVCETYNDRKQDCE